MLKKKSLKLTKMKIIKIKDILKKLLLILKLLRPLKDIGIIFVMMESITFRNVIINMFNMEIILKV